MQLFLNYKMNSIVPTNLKKKKNLTSSMILIVPNEKCFYNKLRCCL